MTDRKEILHEKNTVLMGAQPRQLEDRMEVVGKETGWSGLLQALRFQSRERGWLFSVVAGWCMTVGFICVVAAALAWLKVGDVQDATATERAAARMLLGGVVIILSTIMMWRLNVWGRNVAIVTVACVSWVIGDLIRRKTGVCLEAQAMTIAFVAMAMSCMTSKRVRDFYLYGTTNREEMEPDFQEEKK